MSVDFSKHRHASNLDIVVLDREHCGRSTSRSRMASCHRPTRHHHRADRVAGPVRRRGLGIGRLRRCRRRGHRPWRCPPIIAGPFGTASNLVGSDSAKLGTPPVGDSTIVTAYPDATGGIAEAGPNGSRQGAFLCFPDSERYLTTLGESFANPSDNAEMVFNNAIAYAASVSGVVIPEPSSLLMVGLGLAALSGLVSRRGGGWFASRNETSTADG